MSDETKIDVHTLNELRIQMEQLKDQRTNTKSQLDELEASAIAALVQMGVRYVDASGNGSGPFWVLGKDKTDGSFNRERYVSFFEILIADLKNGKEYSPVKCGELALEYLKTFEKRRLRLNKLSQCRTRGIEDLLRWLNGED
jgi:hypothetical protein